MFKSITVPGAIALGLLCCSIVPGQAQETPRFSRDYCVKVRDDKPQEYAAFLRDVTAKLAKIRVEAGVADSFVIAQAVVPMGASARCDYHIVSIYEGFPPAGRGAEQAAADMKKAGISMTREAMIAKRDEVSYLVGMDIWRWRERVGPTTKGA